MTNKRVKRAVKKGFRTKLTQWAMYFMTTGRTNLVFIIVAVAILAAALRWGWHERQLRMVAEFGYKTQGPVTKTTDAVITSSDWSTKRQLGELNKAARVMGGNLVSGVIVEVPAQSVTIKHDSLILDPNRSASFKDSTFAGTLTGVIVVPIEGPVGLNYTLSRPPFAPQVGFVEKDGVTYALVSWQGQTYRMKTAYAPKVKDRRSIVPFTSVLFIPNEPMLWQVGVETRRQFLGVNVYGVVDYQNGKARPMVGIKKEW